MLRWVEPVSPWAPHLFRSGVRDLGYIEGRDLAIESRYADTQLTRAVELAAELVRLKVDVIAALSHCTHANALCPLVHRPQAHAYDPHHTKSEKRGLLHH